MQTKDQIITELISFTIITIISIAFIFGMGLIVMLLWNWLMPLIFGLITINIWQAIGLILLSSFLIKSKISFNDTKYIRSLKDRFNA